MVKSEYYGYDTFRDYLVAQIKASGQELIDRAESMVSPDLDLISNMDIWINFDPNIGCFPHISYTVDVINKNGFEPIKNYERNKK